MIIDRHILQKRALGDGPCFPFQMKGFPSGFAYPANADVLSKVGGRGIQLNKSLAYAIIHACIVGDTDKTGETSFLQFERVDWCQFSLLQLAFL